MMCELKDKSSSDLEDILIDLMIGPNTGVLGITVSDSELRTKVDLFFKYSSKRKDILSELNSIVSNLWIKNNSINFPSKDGRVKLVDYNLFYKSYLISEIRDIRLKKLI